MGWQCFTWSPRCVVIRERHSPSSGNGPSQYSRQDTGYGEAAFGAASGGSSALQALYATDGVNQAIWFYDQLRVLLNSDSDDDDDCLEYEMDPITFARCYEAYNPYLAKMGRDHDDKMHDRMSEVELDERASL